MAGGSYGNDAPAAVGGWPALLRPPARRTPLLSAEHVDRPGARAELAQAVARPPPRRRAWPAAAASSGSSPERQVGGERRGVRAARAVRRAVGVALAGDLDERARRRRTTSLASSRCPPVTTTAPGPSACTARASSSGSRVRSRPASTRGLGHVRRDHGRASGSSSRPARPRAPRRAAARRTRRPSPGRPRSACRRASRSSALATASIVSDGAEHADLHRVDADVVDHGAHLLDDDLGRDRVDRGHRRPCSAR